MGSKPTREIVVAKDITYEIEDHNQQPPTIPVSKDKPTRSNSNMEPDKTKDSKMYSKIDKPHEKHQNPAVQAPSKRDIPRGDELIVTKVPERVQPPKEQPQKHIVIDLDQYRPASQQSRKRSRKPTTVAFNEQQSNHRHTKEEKNKQFLLQDLDGSEGQSEHTQPQVSIKGHTEPLKAGNQNYLKQYGKAKRYRVSKM